MDDFVADLLRKFCSRALRDDGIFPSPSRVGSHHCCARRKPLTGLEESRAQVPSSAGTSRLLVTIYGLGPHFLILSIEGYIFSTSIFIHIPMGLSFARHSRLNLYLCSLLVSFPQELCGDPAHVSWGFPTQIKQQGRRPKKRVHFRVPKKKWGCAVFLPVLVF